MQDYLCAWTVRKAVLKKLTVRAVGQNRLLIRRTPRGVRSAMGFVGFARTIAISRGGWSRTAASAVLRALPGVQAAQKDHGQQAA
jgi:hypothetical protein